MDALFGVGGSPEIPELNWEEMRELMDFGIDKNRYDQNSLFTSQNWNDDKSAMTQTVNENIKPGFDRVIGGFNQGFAPNDPAANRQALLNAVMARAKGVLPTPEPRPRPEFREYTNG